MLVILFLKIPISLSVRKKNFRSSTVTHQDADQQLPMAIYGFRLVMCTRILIVVNVVEVNSVHALVSSRLITKTISIASIFAKSYYSLLFFILHINTLVKLVLLLVSNFFPS